MYARSTTFHTEPARMAAGIAYVHSDVTPALEAMEGCTGLSVIVSADTRRAIVTSGWRDEESRRASDERVTSLRARGAELFGSEPKVDQWEIAVLHRRHDTGAGAGLRATWTRTNPERIERSIDHYRMTLLPMLEELPGFCSASLFVDRSSGRAVSSVTYDTPEVMVSTRDQATAIRRTAVEENTLEVLEVVEFHVEAARLRAPETV